MKHQASAERFVKRHPEATYKQLSWITAIFMLITGGLVFVGLYLGGWALLLLIPAAYMSVATHYAAIAAEVAQEAGR